MATAVNIKMEHRNTGHRARAQAADSGSASRVLVLGMGVTGVSCAHYLALRGISAVFADSRQEPPGSADIRAAMPDAELFAGDALADLPPGIDHVIISPGVDLQHPLIRRARRQGIEILSDIDVFVLECNAPVIAISGTNGKSTVTTMLGEMLSAAGHSVGVGGNLGRPALDLLSPDDDFYVLELSSFQLERSRPIRSVAATVLNIVPDHLDRHCSFASYVAAKAHIYAQCETVILNRDCPRLNDLVPADKPVISFGLDEPAQRNFGVRLTGDGEFIAQGNELLMPVDALSVTGRHNLANALAALALGYAAGIEPARMLPGLRAFQGLAHRMQQVLTDDGITWIDDSKATNVAAAVMSIRSVAGRLVLIAGGDGKGAGFEDLARALSGRHASVIVLGRDADRIAAALEDHCDITAVNDLPEAVDAARKLAAPGDTVLLAPACSSLDMFDDFSHRGDVFQQAVREGSP